MAFYQLTLVQLMNTEKLHNVFFYRTDAVGATAQNLGQAFEEDILPLINDLQNVAVSNSLLRVINLGDLTDFWEKALTGAGLNTSSESLPAHDAINYTLRLNTRAVRPGSKRISGIPESAQSNGIITVGSYITQMNTLRTALYDTIAYNTTPAVAYQPVVIKRVKETETVNGQEKVTYRLPTPSETVEYGDVVSCLVNTKISHQISRGNGR